MKQEITIKNCSQSKRFNRYGYALYMILTVYLFIKGDYDWAFSNLGIALIFDPFDTTVKWQDRPLYQKAWLLAHVTIMFAGLICLWFLKH